MKLSNRLSSVFLSSIILPSLLFAESSASFASGSSSSSDDYFSSRDFEVGYDEDTSTVISLNNDSASCSLDTVSISGTTITITDEGTYILTGTLDDGMIIVDAEKSDKIQLVLDDAAIHSETSAAIYVLEADKVFVTTAADTTNTLSNGGSFTAIDESNIDAALFSKEDLTLNGCGTLIVTSPGGHGIVSKDSLRITSGIYDISCASQGISGKDDICLANADITIASGKDGIHAENEDDEELGFVFIQSGTFDITAEGDGLSASSWMQIEDGSFTITAGGGSANAASRSSDSWGGFPGGDRHGGGKGGQMQMPSSSREETDSLSFEEADATDESTSMKAIKAACDLVINGGTFSIDSADDAVHSNASVTVNSGTFTIASGDDGFHADDTLTITDGAITITQSYEGLEGLHVDISGGTITLTASDDGINAAGGTDSSGFGGRDQMGGWGPMGGGMSSSDGTILISGGTISVTASGDGIDANGSLSISGGSVTVCGPTQGDTATLDYDTTGEITGGTFIGTGALGMTQTFSSSSQGVISLSTGNQEAGTTIELTDEDGNVLLTYSPELSFAVVILSSPDMIQGENYTVTIGTLSGTFTAN